MRSNLTCPLSVEGRVVGFIFRSSRRTHAYRPRHIELQMAITERLSQAVEKAWRIEQLEEANHAYTQMLGFVSHELKSPVASMVTDAAALSRGLPRRAHGRPAAPSSSGIARKGSTCSASSTSTSTSRASRAASCELEPALARQRRRARSIDEALELVRPQLEAHGMQLVTEMPHEPLPPICCDATLLRIVLVNLLDNAVKYGNEGGDDPR